MTAPGFVRLWDRAPYIIDHLDGQGEDLVIAFSSIGHDPTRPPSPEFVGTATGRGTPSAPRRALFVMDAARSWARDPAFGPALQAAVAQVRARRPIRRIATLGLSMGAVSALAARQVLPVDVALAFGPQATLDARVERRWMEWTADLGPLVPPVESDAQGWTCLFHGLKDDHAQAMGFAQRPGCDHLLFAGQSHSSLVPYLKTRGALAGLVEAALAGDRRRVLRIAASAGGVRRKPEP